jgi:hypothetical protein
MDLRPGTDLDDALSLAAMLEDEEIARKLHLPAPEIEPEAE